MLVYFNIKDAPFLKYPTSHKYVALHGLKLHLQSAPGQFQMLFNADIVVELSCKTLNRTICLVRVLDNERSLKLIVELSDQFWKEM